MPAPRANATRRDALGGPPPRLTARLSVIIASRVGSVTIAAT
ncbi:hypothetical protein [Sorangium cellulosum]|nr:hypothetical protein [Sorangium cellulosum]